MADRDELEELERLHAEGVLTDAEHAQARERVLARDEPDEPTLARDEPGERVSRLGRPNWLAVGLVAIAVAGVALIVVALVGGGGRSPATAPGIAVNGVVVVTDHNSVYPDDPNVTQGQKFGSGGYNVGMPCHTLAGFQDIVLGANVVISDGTGTVLTTAHLKAGVYDENADCVFGFSAAVAKVSTYDLKIGQRNTVSYNQQQIASPQLILQ